MDSSPSSLVRAVWAIMYVTAFGIVLGNSVLQTPMLDTILHSVQGSERRVWKRVACYAVRFSRAQGWSGLGVVGSVAAALMLVGRLEGVNFHRPVCIGQHVLGSRCN